MGAAGRQCGVWALLLAVWFWPGGAALWAERVALVEVLVQQDLDPRILQGQVLQESLHTQPADPHHEEEQDHPDLAGDLRLIRDEDEGSEVSRNDDDDEEEDEEEEEEEGADEEQKNPWIGVVPVEMEEGSAVSNGNQESFAAAVVNKMKRALVLGASALIILVLNQNTVREMDLSQVLSKPVIIIQTSENVTKLIGALLRGLHATAKITYKTFLQNNLGATLTLWSSCGRSRGGLYGEWQGVICTGETNSPVQLHPKQDLLKHLSSLKTRTYRQPKAWTDPTHGQPETDSCAVCLEQYNNNQCLRVLPCLHEFHRDCVDPWLLLQQTCPLCKRSVFGNFC
ncbi:RING finger protein 215 isoform X2 [Salminus brasiliensis]|uniref:RING finger protein 215 isoform X2 n=1 Tax=Salminus brasiliensis TaxID=930266 RepID=UPI003B838F62